MRHIVYFEFFISFNDIKYSLNSYIDKNLVTLEFDDLKRTNPDILLNLSFFKKNTTKLINGSRTNEYKLAYFKPFLDQLTIDQLNFIDQLLKKTDEGNYKLLKKLIPRDLSIGLTILIDKTYPNINFYSKDGSGVKSFDYIFQKQFNASNLLEAFEKALFLVEESLTNGSKNIIKTYDYIIFEEYFEIHGEKSIYYGFIDNDNAPNIQNIFEIKTILLKNIFSNLINDFLHFK